MKKKFEKYEDSSSPSSDEDENVDEVAVAPTSASSWGNNNIQSNEREMPDEEIHKKMLSAKDFLKPNSTENGDDSNGNKYSESFSKNSTGFGSEDSQQSIGIDW